MTDTQNVPIWLVFASLAMCDIRYILEVRVLKCYSELLSQGRRSKDILSNCMQFAGYFELPLSRLIHTTLRIIQCWATKDFLLATEEHEICYFQGRQPLLCGLLHFHISLVMSEMGLANARQ